MPSGLFTFQLSRYLFWIPCLDADSPNLSLSKRSTAGLENPKEGITMRYLRALILVLGVTALLGLTCRDVAAQTSTTGDLTGVVTDPTNAVIPNVKVQLRDLRQGGTRETKTNDAGVYRFSLLPAGSYEVNIQATGFQPVANTTTVNLGQVTTLDLKLSLGATTEKVVVLEEAPLVQTEGGSLSSTLDERTIQNMPNPGNDMTYPLEFTPGVTENTLAGYGNYSVNGMSATGNLFTINGMDDNDPYLSLNNTGATSLMLGQNEVQEATIVGNGYGGQFGGLAGSNVNFVTKSGQNQFHGRASYFWNGRAFNANSFFNNAHGAPKSFVNANQWGGELGGRIVKDKLFWYFDTEGIRLIIPASPSSELMPSPAFEAATLANLGANHPNSVPFYNTIFGLYDAARTAHNASPGSGLTKDPTGCGGVTFAGMGATDPCVDSYTANATIPTRETIYAGRIDYNISAKDHLFGRYQEDQGFQGSGTDPMNPLFNLVSNQPEYQGQISENHTFGPTLTNQLILAGQWYSATFNAPNRPAALAAFPTTLIFGSGLSNLAFFDQIGPQGRNTTQVQVSDDITKISGRHTWKFGVKYRRNDVTDMVYGINTSGTMTIPDLTAFYNGGYDPAHPSTDFTSYAQAFPSSGEQRFKFWTAGGYAEDDIKVKSNLTLTLSLRADHESNPTCKNLCFARLAEPFNQLLNDPNLNGASVPYSSVLTLNNRTALTGLTNIEWSPRFGFAWQPFGRGHSTVIRGGIGLFWNSFPGQVVDNISENPPLFQTFNVGGGTTPLLISPAETNNLIGTATASNKGFLAGFAANQTEAEIAATVAGFVPPAVNFVAPFTHVPQYQKWSLEVQQGFGVNNSVTISYAGNHGIHEAVQDGSLNAYAPLSTFPGGFVGLPTAPPDSRFGYVEGIYSEGISNYNGVSVSATHRYATGQITANYTYSHALDEVSNGGFSPLSYQSFLSTNTSPIFQQNPNSLRSMYGNADYDVRHYFSLNYLWELPFKRLTFGHGPDMLLKGWQVAGTVFVRSGLPFSAVDMATTATLDSFNYGPAASGGIGVGPYLPATATGIAPGACSGPGSDVTLPCFNTSAFKSSTVTDPVSGSIISGAIGNAGRNTLRGPHYFNSDFSILKKINVVPHWEKAELDLGFQFYNVFNHPNFDDPAYNVANTATFGTLQRTISPATTPYGVALGADASPRLIQLKAQFQF